MSNMYKLPVEFKQQWINALRSGEYIQGIGYMKRYDKFCCLGVAYDVLHKEEENSGWIIYGQTCESTKHGKSYLPDFDDYPPAVTYALFQSIKNPEKSIIDHLSYMNDHGRTFDDIANWIEENL